MNRRRGSSIIWGLALIAAGVILMGHMTGLWNASIFFHGWWTLFLIIPAIASMVSDGIDFGNVFLLLLGVWLFFESTGILGKVSWSIFFAALLIVAGIFILIGNDGHWHHHHHHNFDDPNNNNM